MSITLLSGDCRDVLPTLAANSVHRCVTSPPYYALRSYLDAAHPDKHRQIGSKPRRTNTSPRWSRCSARCAACCGPMERCG